MANRASSQQTSLVRHTARQVKMAFSLEEAPCGSTGLRYTNSVCGSETRFEYARPDRVQLSRREVRDLEGPAS